jgi:putative membrane protein
VKTLRRYLPAILVAVSSALPSAAMAQNDTAVQSVAGSQLSAADRGFLQDAAAGALLEIELGRMAAEKGTTEQVRQFGRRIADDQSQASEQLRSIAQSKGVPLPDSLDAKRRKEVERLQKLSGVQFDQAYMKLMLEDHQRDIRDFRKSAQQGSDPNVKSFASSSLPRLHDHLAMVREAEKSVKVTDRTHRTAESDRARDRTTSTAISDPERNRDNALPEAR